MFWHYLYLDDRWLRLFDQYYGFIFQKNHCLDIVKYIGSVLHDWNNKQNKAKANRKIEEPLIMHSDRGVQYVSKEYKRVTANMQCSYSKKAYPWDNACIESFHSLIKREWLNRFKIRDYNHAYRLVFEYLEAFYNTKRIHSHCDYMSPNDYEELYRRLQQNEEPMAS